jgi:MFS family permease
VATAVPEITQDFNSLADSGWYGSAYVNTASISVLSGASLTTRRYLLTIASFQLPFGKLYSILPVKYVFLAAIVIFEVGSVICAAAISSGMLIAGRAIAGLGGAGVYSGTLIIAAHLMPLQFRPIYTGALGAISGIAAICGPLLGGGLTDGATWRWCFWINLPFGGLTIAVVALLTPAISTTGRGESATAALNFRDRLSQFDLPGMVALIPCIICCLLALQWGGTVYPWNSGRIAGLFVTSFVLLCCFIGIQFWKKDNATLPPRVMKNRSVAGGVWFSFAIGATFFIVVYYVSFFTHLRFPSARTVADESLLASSLVPSYQRRQR